MRLFLKKRPARFQITFDRSTNGTTVEKEIGWQFSFSFIRKNSKNVPQIRTIFRFKCSNVNPNYENTFFTHFNRCPNE